MFRQKIPYRILYKLLSCEPSSAVPPPATHRLAHRGLCYVIAFRVSTHPEGAHPLKHPVHLLSK